MIRNPTRWLSRDRPARAAAEAMAIPAVAAFLVMCWLAIGCEAEPAEQAVPDAEAPLVAPAAPVADALSPARPATDAAEPPVEVPSQPVIEARVAPAQPPPPPPRPVRTAAEKLAGLPPDVTRPENKQFDGPPLPAQAQKAVDEARQLIEDGSLDRARLRLERAQGFVPDSLTIHRLLGRVFFLKNNTGVAADHFGRVLRAAPDDIEVQVLMGRIFDKEHNRTRALKAYRTAMLCSGVSADNPLAGFALYRLADLLEADGQPGPALDAFEVLSEWVDQHADVYARDARTAELALKPEALLVRCGSLLLQMAYADEAVELLTRAHDRDPGDTEATRLLLEAYGAAGQYDNALVVLTEYTGDEIRPAVVEAATAGVLGGFIDEGAAQEGLIWLAELIAQHPEWAPAADSAIANVLAARVSKQFAHQFIEGIAAEPSQARHVLHYLAGRLAEGLAMPHLAADQFRAAIEVDPSFIPAHEALIHTHISQGRYDLALRAADHLRETNAEPWMVAYLRGKAMVAIGEFAQAADLLREARSQREDYQPIYLLLAEAYRSQGLLGQAADVLEQAVKLDPDTPGLFRQWLALHCQNGTIHEFATNVVPHLARQHGGSLQFQLMRVEQELWTHDLQAADTLMADLLDKHADELDVQLLGVYARLWMARVGTSPATSDSDSSAVERRIVEQVMIARGRATRSYGQRTVQVDDVPIGKPFHTDLEMWVSGVPQRVLQAELARLNEIRSHWGDDRRARLMTAQVLSALGETDQAIDLWQVLYIADPRDLKVIAGYVGDLTAAGKYVRAAGVLKDALSVCRHDYSIRRNLIAALMRSERYEDAVALLTEWLGEVEGQSDEQWRYRIMLVQAYAGARMFDAGHNLLKTMIVEAEDQEIAAAPFEIEQFRLFLLAGSPAEGVSFVKDKLDQWGATPGLLLPERPVGEYGPADQAFVLVSSLGDYDRAAKCASRDVDVWDDHEVMEGTVMGMLLQSGHYDEAVEVLSAMAAAAGPVRDRDALRWRMLVVYAVAGRYEDGHALLDKWLADKLEVSRDLYGVWKTIYYVLAERRDDAMAFAGRWIRRDSTSFAPRSAAIFLLHSAKRHERLLDLLDEWDAEIASLAPLPDGPSNDRRKELVMRLHASRLGALAAIGRYQEIVDDLAARLEDEPDNVGYMTTYAAALGEVGRDDDALAVLEKAYRLMPNSPIIMNNLAYRLAERGVRLSYAERLVNSALEQHEGVSTLDTQAWVFYKRGRITSAVRILNRVLNLMEEDPDQQSAVVWDHAGDAYYRAERPDEAVEMWRRALDLAQAEEVPTADVRKVLAGAPAKLQAVEDGEVPPVAPLGENLADPLLPAEDVPAAAEEARGDTDETADDRPLVPTEDQETNTHGPSPLPTE